METKKNVLIVGGGIFGLAASIVLGEHGINVTVVEKQNDVMQGASFINQNRIHFGYHYPRSTSTCEEALAGLSLFKEYFGESIFNSFNKYYAVAKRGSHVDVNEFADFCRDLELPLKEAWPKGNILNREMVDICWETPEPIFDFHKLKQLAIYRIVKNKRIRVIRNTYPVSIKDISGEKEVVLTNGYKIRCDAVVNATYAGLSDFANIFGHEKIKSKFELCMMPILEMEEPPQPFGITIMDGPFCSLMPKGVNPGQFILYHVTHSVIQSHIGYNSVDWSPIDGFVELDILELSKIYYPILEKMKLRESWITTRVVLPEQEMDDARPTLVLEHDSGIYSVFSGKLTTCMDAAYTLLEKLDI